VKGKKMALVRHPAALEDDCRSADIVIAPFTIGKRCRAARVIINRRMLRAQGAYALYLEGLSIRAESVAEARGRSPGCRTVWSSKGRHPCRLQATTQPTPISDWAAIQKNKDQ
jgi:competence protein ComEC